MAGCDPLLSSVSSCPLPSTPRAESTLEKESSDKSNVIFANAVSYCNVTTIHGFSYWVSAENIVEIPRSYSGLSQW